MTWAIDSTHLPGSLFLRLLRSHDYSGELAPLYESEHIERAPAKWKPVELSLETLCHGEEDRKITLELNQRYERKKSVVLGSAEITLSEMRFRGSGLIIKIGTLAVRLVEFREDDRPGFLDYVFGGCEVSLIIGVDFTKSNGPPDDPMSLHHVKGGRGNEYIDAITSVGDILQYYDSDKKIPVYGFGAKLPPSFTHVSHCFALNGNVFDPEVQGIEEVVEVYKKACKAVVFHGPTIFSRMINMAAECARNADVSQDHQRYFILLILTDGIINDMDPTIHEIVEASTLPLSIIIVGVGAEDFTMMKELDADDKPLYSRHSHKRMARDIVQFVPYRKMKEKDMELAREVLYEVPGQLVSYMTGNGIKPGVLKGKQIVVDSRPDSFRGNPVDCSRPNLFESLQSVLVADMTESGFDAELVREVVAGGLFSTDPQYVSELLQRQPKTLTRGPNPILKSNLRKTRPIFTKAKTVRIETEKSMCAVCLEKPIDVVLVDCGHRNLCLSCVQSLNEQRCPTCTEPIQRWVRVYDP